MQRVYHVPTPLDGLIMPKCMKPAVRILTDDQQKTLSAYISQNNGAAPLGVALALHMGLRLGEVCGLRWSDIDPEKRILSVRRTAQRVAADNGTELVVMPPKSESSARAIPIPEPVFSMLRELRANADTYIISGTDKPAEPRTMQYRFGRMLAKLGLPRVTFHSLRHRFASSAVEVGFDIKTLAEILGHSRIEVTLSR